MSIGISDEHVELASSLRKWAASLAGVEVARAADTDPEATFAEATQAMKRPGCAAFAASRACKSAVASP